LKSKSKASSTAKSFAYAGILAGAVISGTIAGWMSQSEVLGEIVSQAFWRTPPQQVFRTDSLTILVLGRDRALEPGGKTARKEKALSDMILVAKLDFTTGQITGFTIPRDLRTTDPETGDTHKINYYSSKYGPEATQRVVEDIFGIKVDRIVDLNYLAFVDAVNILGGVDVDVEKRMQKVDRAGGLYIDLQPGEQRLTGYEAMGYARYRNDSDFERQRRQRELLVALKDRMVAQPASLPALADKSVELFGEALTPGELASLAGFVQRIERGAIQLGQAPVLVKRGTTYLDLDTDKLADFMDENFFNPPLPEPPAPEAEAS
jgi:LCP family protein required for cell wall assembly